MSHSSDYEASLKKEGGIPDGPVLESLLAGETLDKKVETKEEEPMSECQVRLIVSLSSLSHFPLPFFVVLCVLFLLFSSYVSLSVSFYLSVLLSKFVFLYLSLPLSLSECVFCW